MNIWTFYQLSIIFFLDYRGFRQTDLILPINYFSQLVLLSSMMNIFLCDWLLGTCAHNQPQRKFFLNVLDFSKKKRKNQKNFSDFDISACQGVYQIIIYLFINFINSANKLYRQYCNQSQTGNIYIASVFFISFISKRESSSEKNEFFPLFLTLYIFYIFNVCY